MGRSRSDARRPSPRSTTSARRVPFIDKDAIRRFRSEHNDPYGGLLCVDLDTPGVFERGVLDIGNDG